MGQCLSAGLACFWIYLQHWSSTVRDAVNTFQRSWSSTFKTDDWIYHLVSLLINAHYTARVIAFWKSQETFKNNEITKYFLRFHVTSKYLQFKYIYTLIRGCHGTPLFQTSKSVHLSSARMPPYHFQRPGKASPIVSTRSVSGSIRKTRSASGGLAHFAVQNNQKQPAV